MQITTTMSAPIIRQHETNIYTLFNINWYTCKCVCVCVSEEGEQTNKWNESLIIKMEKIDKQR